MVEQSPVMQTAPAPNAMAGVVMAAQAALQGPQTLGSNQPGAALLLLLLLGGTAAAAAVGMQHAGMLMVY
eukprot:1138862-Pelagomonas_calceolata.AAC.1